MASEGESSSSSSSSSSCDYSIEINHQEPITIRRVNSLKSYSSEDLCTVGNSYEKIKIENAREQLKESIGESSPFDQNNNKIKYKSMMKKKKLSAKSKSKKKVGFHDDLNIIIDEQTSFRTRSVSLSQFSNDSGENNPISLKQILNAQNKYYVIDKLVFKVANFNWDG